MASLPVFLKATQKIKNATPALEKEKKKRWGEEKKKKREQAVFA